MSTANGHNLDALVGAFRFSREWGMPTGDTFDCPPNGGRVTRGECCDITVLWLCFWAGMTVWNEA
jgi:hypothetical protein